MSWVLGRLARDGHRVTFDADRDLSSVVSESPLAQAMRDRVDLDDQAVVTVSQTVNVDRLPGQVGAVRPQPKY